MTRKETIQDRVKRLVEEDATTKRDALAFFKKWGEWPVSYRVRRPKAFHQ